MSKETSFDKEPTILIGIITYCPEDAPKRFEIMKQALPTLERLCGDNVTFSLWDNNSCEEVQNYLKSLNFIDFKHFSKKNLYDVAPIQFLSRAGIFLDTDFVCHMEDDLEVFSENPKEKLDIIMKWLRGYSDLGGSRILKWEINNIEKYNKRGDHPDLDRANMQSMYNVVSGEKLKMAAVDLNDGEKTVCRAALTNWHWYNFPVICKTDLYSTIIPVDDIEPLQAQEGYMMKKYAETGLLLGAIDEGLVTHLAPPTPSSKTSVRHHMKNKFANSKVKPENMGNEMPIISMEEVNKEVDEALRGLKIYVENS